jgi:hypothetical protein
MLLAIAILASFVLLALAPIADIPERPSCQADSMVKWVHQFRNSEARWPEEDEFQNRFAEDSKIARNAQIKYVVRNDMDYFSIYIIKVDGEWIYRNGYQKWSWIPVSEFP